MLSPGQRGGEGPLGLPVDTGGVAGIAGRLQAASDW
jgi:hypothetical protein